MKFQVFFTENAFAEADQHVSFLANVSSTAASSLAHEFAKLESDLSEMPFSHPIVPFPGRGDYHKLVIDRRYVVIYKVEGDRVFVETIIDARSSYSWLLI